MSTAGRALAAAAESMVGTRFRLHGRDPASGLDCVGLVAASLARIGRPAAAPASYRLRNRDVAGLLNHAIAAGFVPAAAPLAPGDILLVRIGALQHHLLIRSLAGGFIHAHAGLGRVVESPAPLAWPSEYHWRLPADED